MNSPFVDLLEKSKAIHIKKAQDYTTNPDSNPYENFTRANEIINWFPPEYKSFASHIGTKLARLGSLLQDGRKPNNESLDDSFLDLVTYCGLMYGFYKAHSGKTDPLTAQAIIDGLRPFLDLPSDKILYKTPKSTDSPDSTEPDLRPCYRHKTYHKDCDVCVGQN